MIRKRNRMSWQRLAGLAEERVEPGGRGELLRSCAVLNAFWTWASVTLMPSLAASAWYQYALIRKSSTWLESEVNAACSRCGASSSGVFARVGMSFLTCAMQLVELRRIVRDDHRRRRALLRRLALGRDVHPVVERLRRDRIAGDVDDRVTGDAAAAAGDPDCDHKKGAKRQNRTTDLHRGVMVARVSRGGGEEWPKNGSGTRRLRRDAASVTDSRRRHRARAPRATRTLRSARRATLRPPRASPRAARRRPSRPPGSA